MSAKYDPEFKRQLVRQHLEHKRPVPELSEAYGVGEGTIYKWVKAYGVKSSASPASINDFMP